MTSRAHELSPLTTPSAVRSPRIASSEVVEPGRLSEAQRAALADELYLVQNQIFSGVSKACFVRYVIDSTATRTWIQVHRDEDGQAVGYFAVHLYEREIDGRPVGIFRSEVGVLRAYRGARASGMLLIQKAVGAWLRNPRRSYYLLCSPIHPGSYALLVNHYDHVWPHPLHEGRPEEAALAGELADAFGLKRVHADNPRIREVGWVTRDSARDGAYWAAHPDPAVRYYMAQNPGYGQGDGLLVLVTGSVREVLRAAGRLVWTRLRRSLRRPAATADTAVIASTT